MLYDMAATTGALSWLLGEPVFASPASLQNASIESRAALAAGMRAMTKEELAEYDAWFYQQLAEAHNRWLEARSAEIEAGAPDLCRRIDEAVARNRTKRGIWD